MSAGRDAIFAGIRSALGRRPLDPQASAEIDARIAGRKRNLIPERGKLPQPEKIDLFVSMAESLAATVERVDSPDTVPDAVAGYLAGLNLPSAVKMAPDPDLQAIPWDKRPTLEVTTGRAEDPDLTSVTAADAGIAETGTLMLASSETSPTTLHFLPDNHIVVLRAGQVVGAYEDGWDLLRANGGIPRTVNFVSGPSRTGDIEQKIQLGAHGPRRLHIILVEDGG